MRSGGRPAQARSSVADRDAAIVVEGVSKRYPRRKVMLWPPATSMFGRRRRRNLDAAAAAGDGSHLRGPRRRDEDIDADLFEFGLADDLDDVDDDDDDDVDAGDEGSGGDPARPGEMFWALRDISFRVGHGEALGILGDPGAGKSTLLGILGGQAFPTEGRALVREPISPVPKSFVMAVGVSGKGDDRYDLAPALRLLGIDPRLIGEHVAEIEEMAAPLYTELGEREPGSLLRISLATAVIVPSNVVLVDAFPGLDDDFMNQVAERLRERLRAGSAVVIASRTAGLVEEVCNEALVLSEGAVVDRGDAKSVAQRYAAAGGGGKRGRKAGGQREAVTIAPGRYLSAASELRIPPTVAAFNASAAIISGTLRTGGGQMRKRLSAADDEVLIEIVFETAAPNVEAHCGVTFTPRDEQEHGMRLELPEPLRFVTAGTYRLQARTQPGALLAGLYDVRADAVVADSADGEATVIARVIGRVLIAGDQSGDGAPTGEAAVAHWDGLTHWRPEAEWSSSSLASSRKRRDGSSSQAAGPPSD